MIASGPRVSREWLALREPADAAARDVALAERLTRLPPKNAPWVIHDLGCGTGAMGRWLAPLLPGPQHWVLHDRDMDLLKAAAAHPPGPAADGAAITLEAQHCDVTHLDPDDLAGATLITASALLDLLTEEDLAGLLAACAGTGSPMLFTLSVVGRVSLSPAHDLDSVVGAAFNAHQRRVTDRGRLLGPDAVTLAVERGNELGAEILVRDSTWRLARAQSDLAAEWFIGWVGAACEHDPELVGATTPYARRRLALAAAGELTVTVGHADLLISPRRER